MVDEKALEFARYIIGNQSFSDEQIELVAEAAQQAAENMASDIQGDIKSNMSGIPNGYSSR